MGKVIKYLCLICVSLILVSSFSGSAYAWRHDMASDWFEICTGCVTIKVKESGATYSSYTNADSDMDWHCGTCKNMPKGTYKYDFCGTFYIRGDSKSEVIDVRNSGGGCGNKCLDMNP